MKHILYPPLHFSLAEPPKPPAPAPPTAAPPTAAPPTPAPPTPAPPTPSPPTSQPSTTVTSGKPGVVYNIIVYTSSVPKQNSQAQAFITLYGAIRTSSEIHIKSPALQSTGEAFR